jgi:GAF domain-containing protein
MRPGPIARAEGSHRSDDHHPESQTATGQVPTASTGELAAAVDELQYGSDEGPCLDALRGGVVIHVDDLATDDRWDNYRSPAVAHGVASSLSLPLTVEGEILGS